MSVHGPYDTEPILPWLGFEDKYELMMTALDGVVLGAYDEMTVRWLCHHLDPLTIHVVVGWLERRRAEMVRGAPPIT
jgi:hypothetical protein